MSSRSERQFQGLFKEILTGSAVASPGAITTGTQGSVAVTVPGAAVGDAVIAVWPSAYLGALCLGAEVSAANTVTVLITNNSGGTLTPPASTAYYVVVAKLTQEAQS
jgi:hypothetical protein